jgi:hypothetical protein
MTAGVGAMVMACVTLAGCGSASEESGEEVDASAALASAGAVTCALRNRTVLCWGNYDGDYPEPTRIPLEDPRSLGASGLGSDVCAINGDGKVDCWSGAAEAPMRIQAPPAVDISPPCLATTGGEVWCWKYDENGARGAASRLDGLSDVVEVDAGNGGCARHTGGGVTCWGDTHHGAAGNGVFGEPRDVTPPVRVAIDDAVALTRRVQGSCALHADGKVSCWGWGQAGENGDGWFEDRAEPVRVLGLAGISRIGAGMLVNAAIQDGDVALWGVYDPETSEAINIPRFMGVSGAIHMSAGWYHACALTARGEVLCIGDDQFGQMNGGGKHETFAPVAGL